MTKSDNYKATRSRDFKLLLAGQTSSQLGTQVSSVAIPLLAVITLNASAFEVGIINAASTIGFALIGLQVGVWLGGRPVRRFLIASDLVRAVVLGTVPVAALLGWLTIWQLVVVALVVGFARVFFDVGYQSYIPSVLGKDGVLSGNSSMETIRASGQFVGPGIGGWLVAVVGAANVVAVQAITFLISGFAFVKIRHREVVSKVEQNDEQPGMWLKIREGLNFVSDNQILRATTITSAASNFAFAVASSVTYVFMIRTLNLSPTVVGLIIGGGALATMGAAAVTPRLARKVGSVRVVWLAACVAGVVSLIGPFAQEGWLVILLIVSTVAGEAGQIVYAITNVSIRQQLCPDLMLSRVNATVRFLIMGLFPAGALLGGFLGTLVGVRIALLASAAMLAVAWIPLYRALRGYRNVEELPSW